MMESLSLEGEKIIKDVRNLFRLEKLKKQTTDTIIKGIKIFLDYKNKMKKLKIEYLEISEKFLD